METIQLLIPLFVVIGLGYALKRFGVLGPQSSTELNKLVFYIVIPALLFSSARKVDLRSSADLAAGLAYILTVAVSIGIVGFLGLFFAPPQRGALAQASFRSNLAYVGVAITAQVFGEAGLPTMTLIVSAGVVIHAIATITVLHAYHAESEGTDLSKLIRLVVLNPIIISVAAGLLFAVLDIDLPFFVAEPIALLNRMSLPTVLLTIGLRIDFSEISARVGALATIVVYKLFVMPLVGFLIFRFLLGGSGLELMVLTIGCGMPTAVTSQSFASAMSADESLTAAAVSVTTLLILVSVPTNLAVLGFFYPMP
jgi:hypothetical protein